MCCMRRWACGAMMTTLAPKFDGTALLGRHETLTQLWPVKWPVNIRVKWPGSRPCWRLDLTARTLQFTALVTVTELLVISVQYINHSHLIFYILSVFTAITFYTSDKSWQPLVGRHRIVKFCDQHVTFFVNIIISALYSIYTWPSIPMFSMSYLPHGFSM